MRGAALLLSVTLPFVAVPAIAQAGEDELILALEPGYALLSADDSAKHGLSGDLSAWLGVSEMIWLAGSAGIAADFEDPSSIAEVLGGVVIALDVLRVVPYAEAMIGAIITPDTLGASYRVGLGADYLVSKSFSVGAVARYRGLADDLGGDGLFTAQLRLAIRIEL